MYICSLILAAILASILFKIHVDLHKENDCHMTYMWRYINLLPIDIKENDLTSYALYRYMEGFVNEQTLRISRNHIPVLFVPGSGGSAKQVRSIASVMMNKTEMLSAPFRMHFYAIDFNEELSFLSGSILNRQRAFVIKAISALQKMYSHKIVLVGHSFGGTILHALPAHPRYDITKMGIVITLASPISAPPIVMDEAMITFYSTMQKAWQMRHSDLKHVGVVSYSGGWKDFQVPDHLAAIRYGSHVIHRPSWSIRGVDTPADHLCILWCNQLIRHATRILFNYGLDTVTKSELKPSDIVHDFFHNLSDVNVNDGTSTTDIVKIGIFDYPWVSRVYKGTMEDTKKLFKLTFFSPFNVYSAVLASTCDMKMFFTYSNELARPASVRDSTKFMIIDMPYEINLGEGHIVLEGKVECEFELTVKPEVFRAWYLILIYNANALVHFVLSALVAFTLLEKLAQSKITKKIGRSSRVGYYVNGGVIALLFYCFTYNVGIREAVITASSFYFISCAYFLARIVGHVRNKMISTFPACCKWADILLKTFIFLLVPVRASLSYATIAMLIALLVFMNRKEIRKGRIFIDPKLSIILCRLIIGFVLIGTIQQQSSGPFCILLSTLTGIICAGIGLAGSSHESIVHALEHFTLKLRSLDLSFSLDSLSNNFDLTPSFSKLIFLFIPAVAVVCVRLPQVLVSSRDFVLAVLLVVPGFMVSQINMSLEVCSFFALVVLYIVFLF